MVKLIVGQKGKGKTKCLLENVNDAVKSADGNVVFVDKSTKHMFELDKRIRLINVTEFPLENADGFVGFICGIVSQDHDLEQIYIDGILKTAFLEGKDPEILESVIKKLDKISAHYSVDICVSLSLDEHAVPESMKDKILISL
jgi:energy-coupling factor transporter ATP-binding protein EcfA2